MNCVEYQSYTPLNISIRTADELSTKLPVSNLHRYKKRVKEYQKSLKNHILTSRFNNFTWEENRRFVARNDKVGCIYCTPSPLSNIIPTEMKVFILEMNNDTNKIMGIGLVNNHPKVQKYNVYSNNNYNRYSYIGKHRIDRKEMTEDEEKVMKVFDILCFKGNKHMKRGQGLKLFPVELLFNINSHMEHMDLVNYVKEMFKSRIEKKSDNYTSEDLK